MMMLSICRSHTVEPQHQPPLINCFFKSYTGITAPDVQYIIEGSLEVKLPTIWTDEKQSREEAERRERLEERRVEEKE